MKKLVCEMCGSQDLQKREGLYVCGYCGTKYTPEDAKKLFVEVDVNVAVDHTQELEKLWQLARRARKNNDAENAAEYYKKILHYEPNDWEAAYFSTLYDNAHGTIAQIELRCDAVTDCLESVFTLIRKLPEGEQAQAVETVARTSTRFAESMWENAEKHYLECMSQNVSVNNKVKTDCKKRQTAAVRIMLACRDAIVNNYKNTPSVGTFVQIPAKEALARQGTAPCYITFPEKTTELLLADIGKYDPTYVEKYHEKKAKSRRNNNILLAVLTAVFLVVGLLLDSLYWRVFGFSMAAFCGLWLMGNLIFLKKK